MLGLRGHIVKLDFPDEYRDWKTNLHDLIRADVVTVPTHKTIVSGLKRAAKDADRVTIATDFDTEGELIGLEACTIVKSVKDVGVDRVRFSAMTPIEVKRAFRSPTRIDLNLARSGEARQAVDLIWGAALTRFISTSAKRLGNRFLSAGRVQSPTLALIVDRERKMHNSCQSHTGKYTLISARAAKRFTQSTKQTDFETKRAQRRRYKTSATPPPSLRLPKPNEWTPPRNPSIRPSFSLQQARLGSQQAALWKRRSASTRQGG